MTSVIIFKECIQIIEIVTNYSLEKCVSKWNRQGCIANNALQINNKLANRKTKKGPNTHGKNTLQTMACI